MQTFIKTFGFAYRHLFSVLFSSVSRYLVFTIRSRLIYQIFFENASLYAYWSVVFPIQTAHLQQTEWIVSHWG